MHITCDGNEFNPQCQWPTIKTAMLNTVFPLRSRFSSIYYARQLTTVHVLLIFSIKMRNLCWDYYGELHIHTVIIYWRISKTFHYHRQPLSITEILWSLKRINHCFCDRINNSNDSVAILHPQVIVIDRFMIPIDFKSIELISLTIENVSVLIQKAG